MKIGYVGLGAMGSSLARWLIKDHDLSVWDLNPDAVARLEAMGAVKAQSIARLAHDNEAVFLCLPRSSDVEAALFGNGGLAPHLTPGTVVVDQTSGDPAITRALAERLATQGAAMVDAPVAGGVPSALAGRITIMASGETAAYERVKPAFEAMTSKIYFASDRAGDGQAAKMINNNVNSGHRLSTLELVALGRKAGLSMATIIDTLESGAGANFASRFLLKAMNEGQSAADFALELMIKDVNQAIGFGEMQDVPLPISTAARSLMQMALNTIGPKAGLDDIGPFMESITGTRYRDAPGEVTASSSDGQMIGNAIAACNRLIAYENLALGARFGLAPDTLGTIINAGSGWSREMEAVVGELAGDRAPSGRTVGDVVSVLRKAENLGRKLHVPLVVSGGIRALYESWQTEAGAAAGVESIAASVERATGVQLAS